MIIDQLPKKKVPTESVGTKEQVVTDIAMIDPMMVKHILRMSEITWVITCSCCQGHEPGYKAYVYYQSEDWRRLEDVVIQVVDYFDTPQIFLTKQSDYKKGVVATYIILIMPQSRIREVTEKVEELILQPSEVTEILNVE